MEKQYILELLKASSEQFSESEFKLKVNGTSMSPFIQLGDYIFVKHEVQDSFSPGDVLVIIRENDIVTHRLINMFAEEYICKGDNTYISDPPVKREQIFGKVIAIEREGKRISMDERQWKTRNKILGCLGNLENQVYHFGLQVKPPVENSSDQNHHIFVGRIIFYPFRAIMRLISK